MKRRKFLAAAAAAPIAVVAGSSLAAEPRVVVGMDIAVGADRTTVVYLSTPQYDGRSWVLEAFDLPAGQRARLVEVGR